MSHGSCINFECPRQKSVLNLLHSSYGDFTATNIKSYPPTYISSSHFYRVDFFFNKQRTNITIQIVEI